MTNDRSAASAFVKGDEVTLAAGTYQGTSGVFLRLRESGNWADITERNGSIRSHPMAWLAHSAGANLKEAEAGTDSTRHDTQILQAQWRQQ